MKKSDLVLPESQAPIVVGCEVVFIDGSSTMSINSKSFEMEHEHHVGTSEKIYTVVAINISLPRENNIGNVLSPSNRCIVKSEDGDIVFCSRFNIHNIRAYSSLIPHTLKK